MERQTQSLQELLGKLSALPTDWRDETADRIIAYLNGMTERRVYSHADLKLLLDQDFETALTVFRLFLEKSKDEFTGELKAILREIGGASRKAYESRKDRFVALLDHLFIREAISSTVNTGYTWKDILQERLKTGRGSAIKGQVRGRALEDFTEEIVGEVFGQGHYDRRCSFVGMSGQSTEKADFAIPSKEDPRLLIEVKAYGATGSKQTDVLGDIRRIIQQKRPDAVFLLVSDGITWRSRSSDLKKLVELQNQGYIYRIYTKLMKAELLADLESFRKEQKLHSPPPSPR